MNNFARSILLFLSVLIGANAAAVSAEKIPLAPQGYVSDFAHMMSPATRQQIEQLGTQLQQQHQVQMAVVTVTSIGNRPMEDFATDLFAQWGMGVKGIDNGLLLLASKNERQIRIEVGYGLEDKVPDAVAEQIYLSIRGKFRAGDYDGGFLTGAQMLTEAVGGTLEVTRAPRQRRVSRSNRSNLAFWVFFIFFMFISMIRGLVRRATGRPAVRAGSSVPWWLLFLGSGGGGGSSWGGGGFSSGGGGFGGFGGGMSGGGGAGGDW